MTGPQVFAAFTFAVVTGFALTSLSWRLLAWNDRLEQRRARRDSAKYLAALSAMTEAETAEWVRFAETLSDDEVAELAWDDICQVIGLDSSEVACRIRAQIAANEIRRRCDEIERAEGWTA